MTGRVALDIGEELPVVRGDDQGFAVALDGCAGPARCVFIVSRQHDTRMLAATS